MFNLFKLRQSGNIPSGQSLRSKHSGAATLLFAVAALTINTMIVIFAANHGALQDKSITNQNRTAQAQSAADAGLDYGIVYLKSNSSTILANPVGGHIQPYSNGSVTNVMLPNNARFTVTYSNPIANNYDLIQVTATGVSDDGTSSRITSQLIQSLGGGLSGSADRPLIAQGEATFTGNSTITNILNDYTVRLGDELEFNGNGKTVIASGTSTTSSNTGPDVSENDATLASMTGENFFASMFGQPSTTVKTGADMYLSNSSNHNYNSDVNGVTGQVIWIDQTGGTAMFNGNTTIGSSENPVIIVINGDATFTGNIRIYGYIFVLGTNSGLTLTGNSRINGAIGSAGDVTATGNTKITYDSTILDGVPGGVGAGSDSYSRVPGSWRDF